MVYNSNQKWASGQSAVAISVGILRVDGEGKAHEHRGSDMAYGVRPRGLDGERQRGANLVEMVVVLPLLLLLVVGIVDFGRAFYTLVVVTNASREGARCAARYPFDEGLAVDTVVRYVNESGIDITPDNVTTNFRSLNPTNPGQPLSVTVQTEFETIIGSMVGFPSLTIRRTTTMASFGVD